MAGFPTPLEILRLESDSFEIDGCTFWVGGNDPTVATLAVKYDKVRGLDLSFRDVVPLEFLVEMPKIELKLPGARDRVEILPVKQDFNESGSFTQAVPVSQPLDLCFGGSFSRVECLLFRCFPRHGNKEFSLSAGPDVFRVLPLGGAKESDSPVPYGVLRWEIASTTEPDQIARVHRGFSRFETFLSFVAGVKCGIGHITGLQSDDSIAFCGLGSMRSDEFRPVLHWYDPALESELPALFGCAWPILKDEANGLQSAIRRSVYFLRSSNLARRDSVEMALISSFSAVETLVNFVLDERAMWKGTLVSEKVKFSDKLRAAAAYCRLNADPLDGLDRLGALARNKDRIDGFEVLCFVRNKTVHSSPKDSIDGEVLHEATVLSSWLAVVLIFYLIGYRGKMIDARTAKWRGQSSTVPLAQ